METESKFDIIIQMIQLIDQRISLIESHLGNIDKTNGNVEKDCSKMREHIHFIETTYEAVRSPLTYIKNNIDYMMGKETSNLPAIQDLNLPAIQDLNLPAIQDLP